jgi:hypothetical protein
VNAGLEDRARTMAWIAMAVMFVCTASAAFRSNSVVYDMPLTEDGYLSMTIARNIGLGRGVTADARELTNGFQPLWVFAISLWFRLFDGDRLSAVRAVLLTHSVIFIASAHVWARFLSSFSSAHRARNYTLFLMTYLFSLQLIVQSFNGLETGLLLLTFGLAVGSYINAGDDRTWPLFRTACLLGLQTLVRIDAAIFVAILVTIDVMAGAGPVGTRLKRAVILGGVSALFLLPWLAYGWLRFGSLIPISGQSLTLSPSVRHVPLAIYNMLGALIRNLVPTYWGGRFRRLSALMLTGLLVYGWVRLRKRGMTLTSVWRELEGQPPKMRIAVGSLTVFVTVLMVLYARDSNAVFFWPRYMVLCAILGVAWIGTLTAVVWNNAPRLAGVMWAVLCLPSLVFVPAWHRVGALLPAYLEAVSYWNGPMLAQVDLVRRYARPGERVGAPQSGTLGFFIDGAYNLDGKVSLSALNARKQKALVRFMRDSEIELIVDFQIFTLPGRQELFDSEEFVRSYRQIYPEHYTSEYDLGVFRRIRDQIAR